MLLPHYQFTKESVLDGKRLFEDITYADVTVKENGYLYQNESIELDALTDELKKLEPGTRVRIKDEDASLNAYNALTARLDDLSFQYEEKKD